MISQLFKRKFGPIGIDVGTRTVKLVQFSADQNTLIDAVRCEIPASIAEGTLPDSPERTAQLGEVIRLAAEGRDFRGREAVLCLNDRQLFLQNVRVPKADGPAAERTIQQEAAGRIPFPAAEAEFRFHDAAEVRQGEMTMREVIVMACHRPVLQQALNMVEAARFLPIAVDVEPSAWVRSYLTQYRRDEDRKQRAIFVHIGYSRTGVVITQNEELLFAKYIDVGGKQFDETVAKQLKMTLVEAASLRRHNGDRRSEQQDVEIARSVAETCRPAYERLAAELSMCIRYHSVTFRGQPLARIVLGGGEASPQLQDILYKRLDLKCELSDPLRNFEKAPQAGYKGQWDIATGLALHEVN